MSDMLSATDKYVTLLGRLPLWQKLALVVAAMAVPAVMLGCFYFQQTSVAVRQTRGELEGTRFLQALGAVAAEMLTHRGREYTFLSGDEARRPDVLAQEAEVDKQIAAANALDAELGAKLGVSAAWQAFKSQWAALESKGLQQSPEENDAAHAALADHLERIAVRTLAGRSASAAKEIKGLIKDSVQKVADGSVFVSRSGQTLEQIVASVKKVSDIVAEIAAASREQSSGIAQVNRAVLQMDELTQQNAALVEQATTASQSMAHEAHSLHEMMGGYRLGASVQPTSARATTTPRHTDVAPEPDSTNEEPAPRAKRRSPGRSTWSRATGSAQVATAIAVTEDGEWQEF
jgi:hypothetical protein